MQNKIGQKANNELFLPVPKGNLNIEYSTKEYIDILTIRKYESSITGKFDTFVYNDKGQLIRTEINTNLSYDIVFYSYDDKGRICQIHSKEFVKNICYHSSYGGDFITETIRYSYPRVNFYNVKDDVIEYVSQNKINTSTEYEKTVMK